MNSKSIKKLIFLLLAVLMLTGCTTNPAASPTPAATTSPAITPTPNVSNPPIVTPLPSVSPTTGVSPISPTPT